MLEKGCKKGVMRRWKTPSVKTVAQLGAISAVKSNLLKEQKRKLKENYRFRASVVFFTYIVGGPLHLRLTFHSLAVSQILFSAIVHAFLFI